jgi:hypothetical protein
MLFSEKAELFRSWLEEKNINDIEVIDVSGIAADMDPLSSELQAMIASRRLLRNI